MFKPLQRQNELSHSAENSTDLSWGPILALYQQQKARKGRVAGVADADNAENQSPRQPSAVRSNSPNTRLLMLMERFASQQRYEQERKQARENAVTQQIYLAVARIHSQLDHFVARQSESRDSGSEGDDSESSVELHDTIRSSLEGIRNSPFSRSIEAMHVDSNHYYALMHSKGYELTTMLKLLPDAVFMRFIGTCNPKLWLYKVETLRNLHAVRLGILLARPDLQPDHVHGLMNDQSVIEIYDAVLKGDEAQPASRQKGCSL